MRPGSRIGPYEVVREIARGGMGTVYEARDPHLDRMVALKLINQRGASDTALERFWREAEALGKVHHRCVVGIHELGQVAEGPFIAQELIEGEGLDAVAQRGPVDPKRAARILRELCDALAAIHEQGILHRDLKPANVLLRPSGLPVVLDFGLARDVRAESLTKTGQMLGTPVYMAPEQARGEKGAELDERTDVYGLGAILYELLTGQTPFVGSSPFELIGQLLYEDPEWPRTLQREVPAALDAIVRKAMAKEREARYPDTKAMQADLEDFLAGRAPRLAGSGRSWRTLLPLATVGLLVVGGVTAVSSVPPTPEESSVAEESSAVQATKTTDREPLPAEDHLWRLTPGEDLGLMRLDYWDDDGSWLCSLILDLDAQVGEEREAGRCELVFTVRRARAKFGLLQGRKEQFDTEHPAAGNPLGAITHLVGRRLSCWVDPRSGAVTRTTGFSGAAQAVNVDMKAEILGFPASWTRAVFKRLLTDARFGQIFDALLHVRPAPPAQLEWRPKRRSPGTYVARRSKAPSLVQAFQFDGKPCPPEPYTVECEASFPEGRLRKSTFLQELAGAAKQRVRVTLQSLDE